jgi:hypothetical protein
MVIPDSLKDKIVMQQSWGGKIEVAKPNHNARPPGLAGTGGNDPVGEGEWFTAQFRNFGNFQLIIDNIPPVVTAFGIRENADLSRTPQIVFAVRDNNEKIKNFRAELDGRWLRFTNDKERSFIYKFDRHIKGVQM